MAQASTATIYVLNGPNLNMLGTREPETYGHARLADVEKLCAQTAAQFGLDADCRQSNREGELIDFIHEAHAKKAAGIIINAGGYSHTSIALHDAIKAVNIPTVEVHISNIHARENFRHHSFTAKAAFAVACRLRHRRLPARDIGPCRQNRRQSQNLTPKPDAPARHQTESFGSRSWRASQPTNPQNSKHDDSALIRELALLLDETSLTEIEIERAGMRVRVARNISVAAAMPASYQPAASAPSAMAAAPAARRRHGQASGRRALADGRHRLLVT